MSPDPSSAIQYNRARTIFVFGDLFGRSQISGDIAGRSEIRAWPATASHASANRLIGECWGRYIAIFKDPVGRVTLLRDPSGAIPAYRLTSSRLSVVASDVTPTLMKAIGRKPSINRENLALLAANPLSATHISCLNEVDLIQPGVLTSVQHRHDQAILWSPARMAAQPRDNPDLEDQLRQVIWHVIGAWSVESRHVAVELSGGFDSSSVVGALRALRPTLPITGIHYALALAEGDERIRARLVAERSAVTLVEVPADPDQIDYRWLFGLDYGAQPRSAWMDMTQDKETRRIVGEIGADLVLTGHGGDAVFYQSPSASIASDCLALEGIFGPWLQSAKDIARRRRTSVWPIFADILRTRLRSRATPTNRDAKHFLSPWARLLAKNGIERHIWQREADSLLPGKRRQIDSLVYTQLFNGPCWEQEAGRLAHPFMSQPVMETCLAIPVPKLAFGPTDRALARRAFARWLPPAIAAGQIKGGASGYYAQAVVRNLPFMRDMLLDGVLTGHGILDGAVFAACLDRQLLLTGGCYGELTSFLSLEAWTRAWS